MEFEVRAAFARHESDGFTGLRDGFISGEDAGGGDVDVAA